MGDEPTPIGGPASGSRFVTRRSLLALLLTLPPGPVAAASRFSRPWHACGQMVARAVLTLLCLDGLIVHMHVVLDGRHVLMSQQFLQTEGIVAQYQVADRKGMTEDVRADALVSDPCTLADAFEVHPLVGMLTMYCTSVTPARWRMRLKSKVTPFLVSGRRVSERKRWSSPVLPHSANSSPSGRCLSR